MGKSKRGGGTKPSTPSSGTTSTSREPENEPEQALETLRPASPWTVHVAVGLGLASLAVYISTLYPSIAGGDAAELSFIACGPGTAHPPGYPLWTMLTHAAVRLLPLGSPAWRSNACAALCAAACNSVLFLYTERVTRSVPASLLSSGMWAFTPLVWLYSIQAEVFALNNLLAASLLYLTVLYELHKSTIVAMLGAFVIGLGLCNQHTIVFFVVPCVLRVLFVSKGMLATPAAVSKLVLSGLVGLTPYAYLPIASQYAYPGSWGDLRTVQGMLTHLLRKEYGTFRLFSGADQNDSRFFLGLWHYLTLLFEESRYVGLVLIVLGMGVVLVKPSQLQKGAWLCSFIFVLYTAAFHKMANLPIENPLHLGVMSRFWMQSHLTAFPLMGIGVSYALKRFATWSAHARSSSLTSQPECAKQDDWWIFVGVVSLLVAHCSINYSHMDETGNTLFTDYATAFLDQIPKNARLIVKGDLITNSLRYMQQCEGYRKDVQLVDMAMLTYDWFVKVQGKNFPLVTFPGKNYHPYEPGAFSMKQLLEANFDDGKGDLFMAGGWHEQDFTHQGHYEHLPHGYADKVVLADHKVDIKKFMKDNWGRLPNFTLPDRKFAQDRWEMIVIKDYYQSRHKHSFTILNWASHFGNKADPQAIGPLREAARILQWCMDNHPVPLLPYYPRNLGIVYQRLAFITHNPEDHWRAIDAYSVYINVADPKEDGYDAVKNLVENGPHPPRPSYSSA